jgi:nitrite reductase/ring-hydroxylating ferredoxin subunit
MKLLNKCYPHNYKFDLQTGGKQGDPLSATVFSIAMDPILKYQTGRLLAQDRRRWKKELVEKAKTL